MKRTNILIVGAFCILVVGAVLTIYVYTVSQTTDIEKLGTFFGGIGSVVIGLITTILLIITFFKQEEAGELQNIKNETDFLLELYSQMERDHSNIYGKYNRGKEVLRYHGQEALDEFVYNHVFGDYPENLSDYGNGFEAMQLHGVLKSFHLIKTRHKTLPASSTLEALEQKLNIFYHSKLKYTCECFAQAFIQHNSSSDSKSQFLLEFYEMYKDTQV